jgi:hypothetical protein
VSIFILLFHDELKKYSVRPNWDERCCVRGATQLRLTIMAIIYPVAGLRKNPVVMQRESQPHFFKHGHC